MNYYNEFDPTPPRAQVVGEGEQQYNRLQKLQTGGSMNSKTGIELIAQERARQIEKEGWSPEHDAQHKNGELAQAAACYALNKLPVPKLKFPWPEHWDKRKKHDRKKSLIIAGALIAAELDRLNQAEAYEKIDCGICGKQINIKDAVYDEECSFCCKEHYTEPESEAGNE